MLRIRISKKKSIIFKSFFSKDVWPTYVLIWQTTPRSRPVSLPSLGKSKSPITSRIHWVELIHMSKIIKWDFYSWVIRDFVDKRDKQELGMATQPFVYVGSWRSRDDKPIPLKVLIGRFAWLTCIEGSD